MYFFSYFWFILTLLIQWNAVCEMWVLLDRISLRQCFLVWLGAHALIWITYGTGTQGEYFVYTITLISITQSLLRCIYSEKRTSWPFNHTNVLSDISMNFNVKVLRTSMIFLFWKGLLYIFLFCFCGSDGCPILLGYCRCSINLIYYPINHDTVQNWDDMGHVWEHAFHNEPKVFSIFYAKQIDPTECKILLMDPPFNPSKNHAELVSHLFLLLKFVPSSNLCCVDVLNNDLFDTSMICLFSTLQMETMFQK